MHISFYKRFLVILLALYSLSLALFLKSPKFDNTFEAIEKIPLSLSGKVISYPSIKNTKVKMLLQTFKENCIFYANDLCDFSDLAL